MTAAKISNDSWAAFLQSLPLLATNKPKPVQWRCFYPRPCWIRRLSSFLALAPHILIYSYRNNQELARKDERHWWHESLPGKKPAWGINYAAIAHEAFKTVPAAFDLQVAVKYQARKHADVDRQHYACGTTFSALNAYVLLRKLS